MTRRIPPLRLIFPVLLLSACAPAVQTGVEQPSAAADAPPGTDIFLAELSIDNGAIQIGRPINITQRDGYDNQPSFTPDGSGVLYTSIREDGQADIYRFDIARGFIVQSTDTPESEYSPTVVPGGGAFSVVRVEADSAQRLWQFNLDGGDPRLVLEAVDSVGYHAWADANTLALFVLGDPPTLQLADIRTGTVEVIAENVGRSIHKVPGRDAISFVHKVSDDEWWIRELDLATREITPLVRTLPGSEEYAWTPDGVLLMARGSTLYAWSRGDEEWREVADLGEAGLDNITRLAVGPRGERLALVAEGQR